MLSSQLSSPEKIVAASPGVAPLERTGPEYPACVWANLGHLSPSSPPTTHTQGWGGVRVGPSGSGLLQEGGQLTQYWGSGNKLGYERGGQMWT